MVYNYPTETREAQNNGSDGATTEHIRTGGSELAKMLADHTPQMATTQKCKPKARLLTSAECLRICNKRKRIKRSNNWKKKNESKKKENRKKFWESKKEEKTKKGWREDRKVLQRSARMKRMQHSKNPKNTKRLKTSNTLVDKETEDEEIDVNFCCMCFGCYEYDVHEGYRAEWMMCPCRCWVCWGFRIQLWIVLLLPILYWWSVTCLLIQLYCWTASLHYLSLLYSTVTIATPSGYFVNTAKILLK